MALKKSNSLPLKKNYGAIQQHLDAANIAQGHHTTGSLHDIAAGFVAIERQLSQPLVHVGGLIRHASFALPRLQEQPLPFQGTATIPSHVANMTKNLIGGGVLSLSGGIAMYSNSPRGAWACIGYVVVLAAVFGYFALLIAKCQNLTHAFTYRECWERSYGARGGVLVAIVNTLDPLLGIFANASILSQSLQLLLLGLDIQLHLTGCLLLVTIAGLLPLCLLKNLDSLAPFSALGMLAVMGALAAMLIRYWDGSYQPGGFYHTDIPSRLQPSFGTRDNPWSMDALPFVCMVYTAFDMHYNSPRFYAELKDASIPRFTSTVVYSFGLTALLYVSIAIVGFLTFGEHADSYILNNYSDRDPLATASRLAIGLCSLVSYPLNFIGVRDNCLDILGIADQVDSDAKLNAFTLVLLSILTIASCFVTDLGLINSVGGGTTVTLVCFLFPALMFKEAIRKFGTGSSNEKYELWMVMVLMVLGIAVGIVGVYISIVMAT